MEFITFIIGAILGFLGSGMILVQGYEDKAKSGLFFGLIGNQIVWTTKETISKHYFEDRSE